MQGKRKQTRNALIYLLQAIVSGILPLIVLPIFTRILTVADYGMLALAQVYAVIVANLANLGMTEAVERNYFEYKDDQLKRSQLLYTTVLFVLLNSIVFACLTAYFENELSAFLDINNSDRLIFWALCGQLIANINSYYFIYYKNAGNARSYAYFMVLAGIANTVFAIFFVVYLGVGVVGIPYAITVSGGFTLAVISYDFFSLHRISFSRTTLIQALAIAYPLTPRIFVSSASAQLDKYLIGLLATVGGVGIYSIGQRIAYYVFNFMTVLQNVFAPEVYRRMFADDDAGSAGLGRYLTTFVYISIAAAVLVSLFAREIVSVLTPVEYHGAHTVVTILAMYYGTLFIGKIAGKQLVFSKKTHVTSLLAFVGLLATAVVCIPFVMRWGVAGAAWAMFVVGLAMTGMAYSFAQRYYLIVWERRIVVTVYLLYFGSAVLVLLLGRLEISYATLLLIKVSLVVLYLYYGIRIKVVTSENMRLIRNALSKKRGGVATKDSI